MECVFKNQIKPNYQVCKKFAEKMYRLISRKKQLAGTKKKREDITNEQLLLLTYICASIITLAVHMCLVIVNHYIFVCKKNLENRIVFHNIIILKSKLKKNYIRYV